MGRSKIKLPRSRERESSSDPSEIPMKSDKLYTCVNCGYLSPQIYKTYALSSENLMKLLNCKNCGLLIDKYIEYDVVIVVLSMILLDQPAYRHTLLNHPFPGYWKLGIIFPFCEAYCSWCFQKGMENSQKTVDFYELESDFYRVLFRTAFGTVVFHGFILLSALLRSKFSSMVRPNFSLLSVLKGTCMCGFYSIFELIALVWAFPRNNIQFFFIYAVQMLTNIQSYAATTTSSITWSCIIVIAAIWLKLQAIEFFDVGVPSLDYWN